MNILLVSLMLVSPGLKPGETPKCQVPEAVAAQIASDVYAQKLPPSRVAAATRDQEFTYFAQHPKELAKHPECKQ